MDHISVVVLYTTDRLPCSQEYHIIRVFQEQMIVYASAGVLNEKVLKVNETQREFQSKSSKEVQFEKNSGFDKDVVAKQNSKKEVFKKIKEPYWNLRWANWIHANTS